MIPNRNSPNKDPQVPLQARWSIWDVGFICTVAFVGLIYFQYSPILPPQIATHYNLRGIADGWTSRQDLGWLLFGFPFLIWLILLGVSFIQNPRLDSWQEVIKIKVISKLRGAISLGVTIIVSGVTFVPIFFNVSISRFLTLALFCFFLSIFSILYQTQRMIPIEHRGHYHCLIIYHNPDDPLVWVSRISGIGWTLNFAHKQAYIWLIFILLAPFLMIFLFNRT